MFDNRFPELTEEESSMAKPFLESFDNLVLIRASLDNMPIAVLATMTEDESIDSIQKDYLIAPVAIIVTQELFERIIPMEESSGKNNYKQ
jgi:hypothetical protein